MNTVLININPTFQRTPGSPISNSTSSSFSASMRSPIHLELASFKKGTKPDDPPQDVNKSHLSFITNLDVTCSLVTSCDHLFHLDSPSHSSEPLDTSNNESVKLDLFMSLKNLWVIISLHEKIFPFHNITMICSYSLKRLIPHLTISVIMTLMSVNIKMTFSFMRPS